MVNLRKSTVKEDGSCTMCPRKTRIVWVLEAKTIFGPILNIRFCNECRKTFLKEMRRIK